MAIRLFRLASLTRNLQHAGTNSRVNLIVNSNGRDVVNQAYSDSFDSHDRGQGTFRGALAEQPVELEDLVGSSIRVGVQGADMWRPEMLYVWGEDEDGTVLPLALETGIEQTLSTDPDEGERPSRASIPIRPVAIGDDSTVIRRLVAIFITRAEDDSGTDNSLTLTGTVDGDDVIRAFISDTPQEDLERVHSNVYNLPVRVPFTRADLRRGELGLRINGDDRWDPASFALFGFDTLVDRPNLVVPLSYHFPWLFGSMSEDLNEGVPSVQLTVVS